MPGGPGGAGARGGELWLLAMGLKDTGGVDLRYSTTKAVLKPCKMPTFFAMDTSEHTTQTGHALLLSSLQVPSRKSFDEPPKIGKVVGIHYPHDTHPARYRFAKPAASNLGASISSI